MSLRPPIIAKRHTEGLASKIRPNWKRAGSPISKLATLAFKSPLLRVAISAAWRFKWRRLRTSRSVHIAGTHSGRVDEWVEERAARSFLTIRDVANQVEARQRWKRSN